MQNYNKNNHGFTLIELLVVVAIVALLSSIVFASLNTARAKGRDAKRLSDLQQIRTALELYYNDNNGTYPTTGNAYWGNCSGFFSKGVSGPGGYIPNLAPTYIPVLPLDPNPISSNTCYVYNSDGANYNFLIYKTVEGTVPASLQRPPLPAEKDYDIYTSTAAGNW
jgi:general secretion pathway protein G